MPGITHRAIMLDPARTFEHRSIYETYLEHLAAWGYNTLHWHFADDQGMRIVLPSHPELASDDAWTVDEVRRFLDLAEAQGLMVIPELECFGHTRFILDHPDHAALGAAPEKQFNALDPEHPGTRSLLSDLLADVAALFDGPILHVGLDEVNLRGVPRFAEAPEAQIAAVWADHMNWVCGRVRELGKRPAMWSDHLLSSDAVLDGVATDVLVFDWHYRAPVDPSTMDRLLDRGLEVWASPASSAWFMRVLSGPENLANLRQFSAEAMLRRDRGVTGIVNTVWAPWRYLSGAMDWPIALAGHLLSHEAEDPGYPVAFAESWYGLGAVDARVAADAIGTLHAISPPEWLFDGIVLGSCQAVGFTREHQRLGRNLMARAREANVALEPLVARADRHADRLDDYRLTARLLEQVGAFGAGGRSPGSAPEAEAIFEQLKQRWGSTRTTHWDQPAEVFTADRLVSTFSRLVAANAG